MYKVLERETDSFTTYASNDANSDMVNSNKSKIAFFSYFWYIQSDKFLFLHLFSLTSRANWPRLQHQLAHAQGKLHKYISLQGY